MLWTHTLYDICFCYLPKTCEGVKKKKKSERPLLNESCSRECTNNRCFYKLPALHNTSSPDCAQSWGQWTNEITGNDTLAARVHHSLITRFKRTMWLSCGVSVLRGVIAQHLGRLTEKNR